MAKLKEALAANLSFVFVCLITTAAVLAVAYVLEKLARKRDPEGSGKGRILGTRQMAVIGMFSAIAGILFCFDIALPIAPNFYKLDISELPALIAGLAFGPVAAVLVEFLKIVVKLFIKSTSTAFVGELANFLVGSMLLVPATAIYRFKRTKKAAVTGLIVGTLIMTVFGTAFNALYLLPAFAKLYGMPLDTILGMGTAINPAVKDLTSFVVLMVAPINLIKGALNTLLTLLIYKKISPIIKGE